MQLKLALQAKGITERRFWDIVADRYLISYQNVSRYCRFPYRRQVPEEILNVFDPVLKKLGVEWNE